MDRSETDVIDNDTRNSYLLVSVRVNGEIHILHNSHREMIGDMRPFKSWMRGIDMIPDDKTYEYAYNSLRQKLFDPADDVMRLTGVVEIIDTIRNSRNRSNKKCISETFSSFRKKIPDYEDKLDMCQYSLERLLENNDGEILYGFIKNTADNYIFEMGLLSFSGIVDRRMLSGKFDIVYSGRYT